MVAVGDVVVVVVAVASHAGYHMYINSPLAQATGPMMLEPMRKLRVNLVGSGQDGSPPSPRIVQ